MRAILLNDTSVENHIGCYAVTHQILSICKEVGLTICATVPVGAIPNLSQLANFDVILVNAEGTFHGASPYIEEFINVLTLAQKGGSNVFMLNSTFQDLSPKLIAQIREFHVVVCRDRRSCDYIGGASIYCPDLAFTYFLNVRRNVPVIEPVERDGSVHTCSKLKSATVRLFISSILNKSAWLSVFMSDSTGILRTKGKPLTKSYVGRKDILFYPLRSWAIHHALSKIKAVDSSSRFFETIIHSRLLVSGRYHAVVVALASSTPFRFLSADTRKIENLLADVGLDKNRFELKGLLEPIELKFTQKEILQVESFNRLTTIRYQNLVSSIREKIDEMRVN